MSGLMTEELSRGKSSDLIDLKLCGPLFGNKRASPVLHLPYLYVVSGNRRWSVSQSPSGVENKMSRIISYYSFIHGSIYY